MCDHRDVYLLGILIDSHLMSPTRPIRKYYIIYIHIPEEVRKILFQCVNKQKLTVTGNPADVKYSI